MYSLSPEQNKIHLSALELAKRHRAVEAQLIEVLQKVDRMKIFKSLGKNSLFAYATEILGLEKNVAYPMITIARKSMTVPELKTAISNQTLNVSKASRIVSSLNSENAKELVLFAETHSRDEIDFEMAKRDPKTKSRDKMKPLSEDWVEVTVKMSRQTFEKLKRAESLEAQKNKDTKWGAVIDASLEAHLEKNDPVRKAKRIAKKPQNLGPARVEEQKSPDGTNEAKRIPLTAEQKRAVLLRDHGRCTHVGLDGKRCDQDRWLHTHHIIPVSLGGTNDLENLTTLCSVHHDLVHQMSLPIDGQVTWLRSPRTAYSV